MTIVIILAVIAVAAFVYMQSKNDKSDVKPSVAAYFPCILEGNVNMPPMADVEAAAIIDVKAAGLFVEGMTAQDCMALCSQPVPPNTFGGGGAYGGRYLVGSYHFEIDAQGQRIDDRSWLKLFSDEKFPVTGGITGAGDIAMGSIGGVDIRGSVATGKPVGKAFHGAGMVHIYGVMDGVWRAV